MKAELSGGDQQSGRRRFLFLVQLTGIVSFPRRSTVRATLPAFRYHPLHPFFHWLFSVHLEIPLRNCNHSSTVNLRNKRDRL